ncbi:MAG: NAD-dependent epimerase/dehydratase family protein [Dehalococcoidia bacterium]
MGNEKAKLSTVLITGGCGFVGTNVVEYLSQRGYAVRILDNLSTSAMGWTTESPPPTEVSPQSESSATSHEPSAEPLNRQTAKPTRQTPNLLVGDIRDKEAVAKAVDGVDAVVHLAAHTSVVESVENPEEDWDINVNGTLNLLEACRRRGVEKFILASSNAVAGEQEPPIDETKVPQPLSPYGASKLAAEGLCSAYYHSFGLKTVALRFANVYGPHSEHKSSVITKFMKKARKGEPLVIYGDGNQTRDFVHVDDICQAIHLVLTADSRQSTVDSSQSESSAIRLRRISHQQTQQTQGTQGIPLPWGEVFQIASGVETTINELVKLILETANNSKTANSQLSTIYEPERPGEIKRNYSDISKARTVLGFEPVMNLERELSSIWESYNRSTDD